MKIGPVLILSIFLAIIVMLGMSLPALAAPAIQQIFTNTPDASRGNNIYYIIKSGDTCSGIALQYKILDFQLRQWNQTINADCSNLIPGHELLVGTTLPVAASATPGPLPTPLPPTITPTPEPGTTEICVLLYNDLNGDALHQTNEPVIEGGAISVTETNGKYSKTLQTAINPDPNAYPGTCFVDVPEGSYNIGVAIPDNYNPTTSLTYALELPAGDTADVDFGAQARDTNASQPGNTDGGGGPSPILGFLGGLLLLGGISLGWYALRLREPQSRLKRSGLLKK